MVLVDDGASVKVWRMHSGQWFRPDTGRWTVAQCDAGFGARTSCVRTGPSGASIRTACELDERRSSGMMTSSDRGQQAARQDLHGGAVPCETVAGSAASSLPVTRGRSDSAAVASASNTGVLYPPMLQQGSAAPLGQ
jgi:hypothetical protein